MSSNKAAVSLDRYTEAVEALDAHIAANKSVFAAHEAIVNRIIDVENALRDCVAEVGAGVSNGGFRVTITPQIQTWGDIEEIDKIVAAGRLSAADRERIVKTQARSPRITISRIAF